MASKLSGISREAFTLVRRNVVPLIIATILPVLLMSVFGAANIVMSLNEVLASQAKGPSSAPQGTSTANLIRFFAFGFAGLFLYCWMVAKVSKLCLTGETATIIGSGGTLRAGFWLLLYYFAAALVLLIPIFVVMILASIFDLSFIAGAVSGLGAGRIILTLVAVPARGALLWLGAVPFHRRLSTACSWRQTGSLRWLDSLQRVQSWTVRTRSCRTRDSRGPEPSLYWRPWAVCCLCC